MSKKSLALEKIQGFLVEKSLTCKKFEDFRGKKPCLEKNFLAPQYQNPTSHLGAIQACTRQQVPHKIDALSKVPLIRALLNVLLLT